MGDYAVLSYEATINGVPLGEAISEAPAQLQGRRNAWIFMDDSTPCRVSAERSSE